MILPPDEDFGCNYYDFRAGEPNLCQAYYDAVTPDHLKARIAERQKQLARQVETLPPTGGTKQS